MPSKTPGISACGLPARAFSAAMRCDVPPHDADFGSGAARTEWDFDDNDTIDVADLDTRINHFDAMVLSTDVTPVMAEAASYSSVNVSADGRQVAVPTWSDNTMAGQFNCAVLALSDYDANIVVAAVGGGFDVENQQVRANITSVTATVTGGWNETVAAVIFANRRMDALMRHGLVMNNSNKCFKQVFESGNQTELQKHEAGQATEQPDEAGTIEMMYGCGNEPAEMGGIYIKSDLWLI